jgi:hypothetical protein
MKTFGQISPKDYTIQTFFSNSPFNWRLVSSSLGTNVVEPSELDTAVTILRGNGDRSKFLVENRRLNITPAVNENGVYEHVLYSSIKQLFYNNGVFFSGSIPTDTSLVDMSEDIFVVTIGQDFYGERIKPGSFELGINNLHAKVFDDSFGNLFVSESGQGFLIGNIFYENGIAVINHNTGSVIEDISENGIKIIENSNVYVNYESSVKNIRHEISVKLKPSDFNFSWFNPSVRNSLIIDGELSQEIKELNIPELDEDEWTIQSLIQSGVIKPYVTTIGLYTDKYELVAIAKLSTPIQRTFDSDQIFIVRFDT